MARRGTLGKSGKCFFVRKHGRSKASLFSALTKLSSLVRDFPVLHRLLEQHLQPFSWAPGTVPGSCLLTRVHSGFVPHCLGTHRSGTDSPMLLTLKIPLLLHLSWGFFSWKFPPNQHPQVILLMNFTSVWPLNLWADYFRTLMEKIVFSVVLQSKIYWVNSSAGYSKLLFKYRECLTHSNVR